MYVKFNTEFSIAPYIAEEGRLMLDCTVNDQDIDDQHGVDLVELFADFMNYFRLQDGLIAPYHHKEVLDMVGLLRMIAREMEVEIEGSRE
jgi:hypothetical protein